MCLFCAILILNSTLSINKFFNPGTFSGIVENFCLLLIEKLVYIFIALIHPIQWTIAYPDGADWPAKRQKKTSCVSTGLPVRSTSALTRWRVVLPSCLDSVTSWHLFHLVRTSAHGICFSASFFVEQSNGLRFQHHHTRLKRRKGRLSVWIIPPHLKTVP